jgi:hypothetical protein
VHWPKHEFGTLSSDRLPFPGDKGDSNCVEGRSGSGAGPSPRGRAKITLTTIMPRYVQLCGVRDISDWRVTDG